MTDLSTLNSYSRGDKLPGFTFVRIGDGVRLRINRSNVVDVQTDSGPRTKLVIEGEVLGCKGGIKVTDPENPEVVTGVEDFAVGQNIAVWLPAGFGIGAVADALKAAGTTVLADGGEIKITLTERRSTGKAKPANVYAAEYTAPVGGTNLAAVEDDEAPF